MPPSKRGIVVEGKLIISSDGGFVIVSLLNDDTGETGADV